ncbi:MAG: xanthine dehydrogenase family protein molybdopterin-binding subunit [Xanthobacteraceae bacterium]|jgi:carbon-monoxide dehydrogenase large subunit
MNQVKFGISQSVLRMEDDPLLRGAGRYTSDHMPTGTLHAVVLRSPHANAEFRISDVSKARGSPGVRLILTGEDTADLGKMPMMFGIPDLNIPVPPYEILARENVHHVGDAIAFVVADTLEQAKDAAEAIVVDWRPRAAVIDAMAALAPGAPLVWPDRPGNLAFEKSIGDKEKTDAAFRAAAKTVALTVVNQRLVTNYLDTRAAVAEYDEAKDRLTLTLGSQGPHRIRDVLCKMILNIPVEKMRVITPDTGGGFGTKLFPYREYALVAVAAKNLKRPVTWVAERTEHFLCDAQGRDNVTTAELALDASNKFLALRVDTIADMGGYLSAFAPYIPYGGAGMLPGVYDFPTCYARVRAAYTNTLPVDAYRGAGRPEASYVLERLVDVAARELGVEPDALRKRNFIKPKQMPYTTPTDKVYDSGEFAAHMARAQDVGDWKGFRKRWAQARRRNKLRGIGLATYIEVCGGAGPQLAVVRLERGGNAKVVIGSQSTGQGHQTAYAQLIAEHLDLPPERVTVVQGDTDSIVSGFGTGGSSSIPAGGASVSVAAKKLADNLKKLAAEALEAGPSDLEMADGRVRVVGTDRTVSFADLAERGKPDQLVAEDAWTPQPTFPNGTHLVEVEIDPPTGRVDIVNYVVVDDFGVTINPLLLEGQVVGGAVQGIGQALMERTVYDKDSGQLVTASLMDYALPRADDAPAFHFETRNIPCTVNILGVKGAGEAGTIGAAPAVMNAIADALWRAYRIRHIDMPATPERVWAAIHEGMRLHTL